MSTTPAAKVNKKIPELQHRNFRDDEFWKKIPAWASVTRDQFGYHLWQLKNSIRKVDQVKKVLGNLVSDEIMKDGDDYMRQVIIRYAPDQESTEESRQQGLAALADFFGDERFSKFPAHNIQKMDVTDEDDYEPLDRFLMDDQIKDVIVTCCDSDDLKSDFASVYEDFANKIYAGQNVGKWARETLGFGNWFELCFYVC